MNNMLPTEIPKSTLCAKNNKDLTTITFLCLKYHLISKINYYFVCDDWTNFKSWSLASLLLPK